MAKETHSFLSGLSLFTAETPLKTQKENKQLYRSAEETEGNGKSLIGTIADRIKTNTQKGLTSIQNVYEGTVTSGRRLKFFFLYLLLAALCLFGSSFFLPMLLLFPEKFAFLFTLAGICVHIALSYLRVNQLDYVKDLLSNCVLSTVYFSAVVGTLWAAVLAKSYVLVLGFTGLQAGVVVWFFFSLFPGGTTGLKAVMRYGVRVCCFWGDDSLPLPI